MRSVLPLAPVLLAALLAATTLRADDPSKVDPAKRDETHAPPANTIEPEKRELPRADVVQERRAPVPEKVEKKTSTVGDRRAPIDLSEPREKTIIDKKMRPKPEAKPRDLNRWNHEKAKVQPRDATKENVLVDRYQDRMKDAAAAASQRQPEIQKRTTFSSLNRFIFRRNQPEGDAVTPAGGATPSAAARP